LPTAVDTKGYPVLPLAEGPLTIGWIGTPITEKYLHLVAEPLRHLQQNNDARVRLIGVSENFCIPGVAIERIPWRENTEAAELARCHVGIMPLPDEAWERGKCGYKLVQYMAAARPVIASPVGANRAIVVPGQTGILADGTGQWIEGLQRLAVDRDYASKLGMAGRRRAEEMYSLQVTTPQLIEVFRDIVLSSAPTVVPEMAAPYRG